MERKICKGRKLASTALELPYMAVELLESLTAYDDDYSPKP